MSQKAANAQRKIEVICKITGSHLVRKLPGCASQKEANMIRYCHISRAECLKETTDISRLYKIIFPPTFSLARSIF